MSPVSLQGDRKEKKQNAETNVGSRCGMHHFGYPSLVPSWKRVLPLLSPPVKVIGTNDACGAAHYDTKSQQSHTTDGGTET